MIPNKKQCLFAATPHAAANSEILSPEEAWKENAFKLTRITAVQQVKQMVSLVDDIAKTTIVNSVEGEELRTKATQGVEMIMSKIGGSSSVGRATGNSKVIIIIIPVINLPHVC